MAENVEIKARLSPGRAAFVRSEALARASRPPEVLVQTDTFYAVPRGRLKLRVFADGSGELIAYDRPDRAGPKLSSYVRSSCSEPGALHEALSRSVGARGVVEKRREVIQVGQTRVHLDEVRGLGHFLELEVVLREDQSTAEGEAVARELMALFEIDAASLVDVAYIDLLEATGAISGGVGWKCSGSTTST